MIDLNLILTFLEVAKTKNLNLVAQKFSITQPALSQRIKALEIQVGKSLFLRKQAMELSHAGIELFSLCKNYLNDITTINNWIAAQKETVDGNISIMTTYGQVSYIFPEFLNEFLQKYPSAEIACKSVEATPIVENAVLSGKSDLGVIVGKCKKASLKVQTLLQNNQVFMICSTNHPLAHQKNITKDDLYKTRLLLHSERQSRTMKKIMKIIGLSQNKHLNVLRLPDMESCKIHAMKGLGVAFVAKMYILKELKNEELVMLPNFELKTNINLISRSEKFESPLMNAFKKDFVSYCRKLDDQLANN